MARSLVVTARSASDNTDDWPYWMLWDGASNVTVSVLEALLQREVTRQPFLPKRLAILAAEQFNAMG